MNAAHPLRVALGEIVVHRHHVHALAGERVEVCRQGRHEGLALTRAHLGDVAQMQGRPAHELNVVMTLSESALGSLANRREGLRQQVVEGLSRSQPLAVLVRQRTKLLVSETDEVLLDCVDGLDDGLELAQDLALAGAKDLVEHSHSGATFPLPDACSRPQAGAARMRHVRARPPS